MPQTERNRRVTFRWEETFAASAYCSVEANSVVVTICIVGVSLAGCVHSSVIKPGANERESELRLVNSL